MYIVDYSGTMRDKRVMLVLIWGLIILSVRCFSHLSNI